MGQLKDILKESPLRGAIRRLNSLMGDRGALYELQTIEVMRRVLSHDSSYVDVGTHRGELLRSAVKIAPNGHHHAFEPLPQCVRRLRRDFPQVKVHECALSDHQGTSDFHHVTNATTYSGLRRRLYDRPDPVIEVIAVAVSTLDDAIGAGEDIVLIKIDVEGGEYHVLKGGLRLLRRCRPVVVFEAGRRSTGQYGVTPEQVVDWLESNLDYRVSTMERWLSGRPSLTRDEFVHCWNDESEYCFLASP